MLSNSFIQYFARMIPRLGGHKPLSEDRGHELIDHWIASDFPCVILKINFSGTFNGYIGVPPSHPWYGKNMDEIDIDVHGGLTYSEHQFYGNPHAVAWLIAKIAWAKKTDKMMKGEKNPMPSMVSIYERWLKVEEEHAGENLKYPVDLDVDIWWLGFDTGHAWDVMPAMEEKHGISRMEGSTFKDEDYVRKEVERMLHQAVEAMKEEEEKNNVDG